MTNKEKDYLKALEITQDRLSRLANLTAKIPVMRKALGQAESFIADELEIRSNSFMSDPTGREHAYIREAKRALRAMQRALKEGK